MFITPPFLHAYIRLIAYAYLMAAIAYTYSRSIYFIAVSKDNTMKAASDHHCNGICRAIPRTGIQDFLVISIFHPS